MSQKKRNTHSSNPSLKLNLGCGINLVSGFINIDKYRTLKQLQSKKGLYRNAVIEPGAEFIQADAAALPFDNSSVDYIESIDMIEHIPFREVATVFSEIARVLKPGGKLSLLTNSFDYMAEAWTKYLANPGFAQDQYFELCELIYGNQIGPGEFHCAPFNPIVLNSFIISAGLTLDNMTMYPTGSTDFPKMRTSKPSRGQVIRSDMIWAQAHK